MLVDVTAKIKYAVMVLSDGTYSNGLTKDANLGCQCCQSIHVPVMKSWYMLELDVIEAN